MDMNHSITEKVDMNGESVNGDNMHGDRMNREMDENVAVIANSGASSDGNGVVKEYPTGFRLCGVLGSLVMSMLLVRKLHFHIRRENADSVAFQASLDLVRTWIFQRSTTPGSDKHWLIVPL